VKQILARRSSRAAAALHLSERRPHEDGMEVIIEDYVHDEKQKLTLLMLKQLLLDRDRARLRLRGPQLSFGV